jgi:hypothetical protein
MQEQDAFLEVHLVAGVFFLRATPPDATRRDDRASSEHDPANSTIRTGSTMTHDQDRIPGTRLFMAACPPRRMPC